MALAVKTVLQFTLVAVFVCEFVFPSPINVICLATKRTVAKPDVKYMLSGELHVSWSKEKAVENYSVNICCKKPPVAYSATCSHVCPSYKKIKKCLLETNAYPVKDHDHCSILVYQYINYSIFLTAEFQGCQIRSDIVRITPLVNVAYPSEVKEFGIVSQSNGLLVYWANPYAYVTLCYSLTCYEMQSSGEKRQIFHSSNPTRKVIHGKIQVLIPFNDARKALKAYQCCIKTRLCGRPLAPYSNEVCNMSMTPALTPSNALKMLCGLKKQCPTVVKNIWKNVTLRWKLLDKNTLNSIQKNIVLEVRKAEAYNVIMRSHVLSGSATEYTLTGLEKNVDYYVDVSMCTNGGCGTIRAVIPRI